jgi:hypothetical protein
MRQQEERVTYDRLALLQQQDEEKTGGYHPPSHEPGRWDQPQTMRISPETKTFRHTQVAFLAPQRPALFPQQSEPKRPHLNATAARASSKTVIKEAGMPKSKTIREEIDGDTDIGKEAETDDATIDKSKNSADAAGVLDNFPIKLYRILEEAEKEGKATIVSFLSHGRAFVIHKPRQFVSEIMPKYFTTIRMTSFQRQLNFYGFRRITEGRDTGAYFHVFFLQGQQKLCTRIKRKKTPDKKPPQILSELSTTGMEDSYRRQEHMLHQQRLVVERFRWGTNLSENPLGSTDTMLLSQVLSASEAPRWPVSTTIGATTNGAIDGQPVSAGFDQRPHQHISQQWSHTAFSMSQQIQQLHRIDELLKITGLAHDTSIVCHTSGNQLDNHLLLQQALIAEQATPRLDPNRVSHLLLGQGLLGEANGNSLSSSPGTLSASKTLNSGIATSRPPTANRATMVGAFLEQRQQQQRTTPRSESSFLQQLVENQELGELLKRRELQLSKDNKKDDFYY